LFLFCDVEKIKLTVTQLSGLESNVDSSTQMLFINTTKFLCF